MTVGFGLLRFYRPVYTGGTHVRWRQDVAVTLPRCGSCLYAIGKGSIIRITCGMPHDSENSEVDFRPAEASWPIHPRSESKKSDAFLRGNNKGTISVPEASPEFLCAPWNYVKSLT